MNRQEVETLFVLGAGASFGLSTVKTKANQISKKVTPLDKDFLRCLKAFQPTIGWRKTSTDTVFEDWFDRELAENYGLEEAIIKRVNQYEFLSSLHPIRTKGKCGNEDYLNHISHLITAYLNKCRSNRTGNTKKLIDHVFPAGEASSKYKNRIITFNYDTIIERPLIERGLSKKRIYFDRIVSEKSDGLRRKASEKFPHPLILKLHGSVNWRCLREYFDHLIRGSIDPTEKIVIWTEDDGDPQPDDQFSPLIIPPIPNKPITASGIFRFLWTLAYEYMHVAKRIVIVGYSCPPTDTLARTMFNQFRSNNLEEIYVVDPNAITLKNYRDMFESSTASRAKWRYYPNIAEYIDGEVRK